MTKIIANQIISPPNEIFSVVECTYALINFLLALIFANTFLLCKTKRLTLKSHYEAFIVWRLCTLHVSQVHTEYRTAQNFDSGKV